jgi:hypothetical protein
LEGLGALDSAKDESQSTKRAVIEFAMEPPEAIKFVGWWFDVSEMQFSNATLTIGPVVPSLDPGGVRTDLILAASPFSNARHVLAISCIPVPRLGLESEIFMFYGGFSAREIMTDPTKEAGFLAFIYPVADAEKLRECLGSADYSQARDAINTGRDWPVMSAKRKCVLTNRPATVSASLEKTAPIAGRVYVHGNWRATLESHRQFSW